MAQRNTGIAYFKAHPRAKGVQQLVQGHTADQGQTTELKADLTLYHTARGRGFSEDADKGKMVDGRRGGEGEGS